MKAKAVLSFFLSSLFFAACVSAQTTAFNFQGRLNDGVNPANGNFELQFKLFDSTGGGPQIGGTVTRPSVAVINGIFSTQLDFGAAAFDGSARFVEIAVRPAGNPNPFTVLNPRQQVLSTPYAIQAKNAAQLGGVDASEYVTTSTAGNSFIKNDTAQQAGNFNISGNGVVGDSLGVGIVPRAGVKLDVVGAAIIAPTAAGTMQFGNPNSETGMTTLSNGGRADLRFDGQTVKLVAGPAGAPPAATSGLAIDVRGFVGIGTDSPASKLDVVTDLGAGLHARGGTYGVLASGGTGVSGSGGAIGVDGLGTASGVRGIATTNGQGILGIGTTWVFGYSADNVIGIGVAAAAGASGSSRNSMAFAGFGTSYFSGDTTPLPSSYPSGVIIGSASDIGYVFAFDYRNNTARNLTLNGPGGRVGIGTTAPDQTLTVNGQASKPGGGSWATFSDERLKNIGSRFTTGLSAVMKLQPLRYRYKANNAFGLKSEEEYVGFSAQSVEKLIPEAITKTDTGFLLVNNDPIMWTMLNAIKEQQSEIEAQKKDAADLREQVDALKKLVCATNATAHVCKP